MCCFSHRVFTKSSDTKGHSDPLSFRLPPEIAARIEKLVAESKATNSKLPRYDRVSDFLRDATHHWLEYIVAHYQRNELDEFIAYMHAAQDIADEELYNTSWQATVERYKSALSVLEKQGTLGKKRARAVYKGAMTKFDKIKDPYWQELIKADLARHYGYLGAPQPSQQNFTMSPKTFTETEIEEE